MGVGSLMRSMSTSRLAASLGLVLVLGGIGVSILAVWKLRENTIAAWRSQLNNVCLALASHASQTFDAANLVLDGVAQAVAAEHLTDPDSLRTKLAGEGMFRLLQARAGSVPSVDVLTLIDDKGNVVNYSRTWPPPPINLLDRDYFKAYSSADPPVDAWVSAPVRNRTNGKWTFYVARRIEGPDRRFLGVIIVGMTSQYFARFYGDIALGPGADLRLYRRDLTLLAASPHRDELIGRQATRGGVWQIAMQGGPSVVEVDGPRAVQPDESSARMVAARVLDGLPLVTAVTVQRDVYLADWRHAVLYIGLVTAISTLAIITAFTALVQVLRRREADMRHTEALRQAAEAANVAKTEFLATMSHEVRTPLNGVLGATELLTRTALSEAQWPLVDTLGRSGRALLAIIDEILDFSKLETGALRIERAPFDVGLLLVDVVEAFRTQAQAKGLALQLDEEARATRWVTGDAGRVRQVLVHLLSNALKFTPQGQVRVSAAPAGDDAQGRALLRFSVRDTGIGIAPSLREQLFRPFVQADGSPARRFGGAGLGLALSQRLCELMDGRIGMDSEDGGGSHFWFELPLPQVQEHVARRVADAPPPSELQRIGAAVRVLLVEDNEVNALVIQAQLSQLGCHCDLASGGEQALRMMERERYDLVFMDCMMPDIDGYEVTRRVRSREASGGAEHVPIVALTANVVADSPALSKRAGMDDHMSKPCSIEGLAAAIQRWARGASGPASGLAGTGRRAPSA